MGQYPEGNPGFDDTPLFVVTLQQSESNTKYKSAILNQRGEIYCLGFVLDLQGRLLLVDAVAGVLQDPGVCEGDLVTTPPPPPPHQDGKRQRVAVRTVGTDFGRSK